MTKTEKKFIENFSGIILKQLYYYYSPNFTSFLVDKVIVIDQGKIVGSGSVDGFLKATKTGKESF